MARLHYASTLKCACILLVTGLFFYTWNTLINVAEEWSYRVRHASIKGESCSSRIQVLPDLYTYKNNYTKLLDYIHVDKSQATDLKDEVTIVTMYFNIGTFQKGSYGFLKVTPLFYRNNMKVFASLKNPVVAFFDTPEDKEYFEEIRRPFGKDRTKTFLVRRQQLWAFDLRERIAKIFRTPSYPKHFPNTVIPEYSCAMHAKYEMIRAAGIENFFNTRYFAWLDIGYFRDISESDDIPLFEIWLPPNYNSSTVAYNEVEIRKPSLSPQDVIWNNEVWLGGGFFIGELHTIIQWSLQYMLATEVLIQTYDLISTDQQVIYIIYNACNPNLHVQVYREPDDIKENKWFYLGYLSKEEGNKRNTKHL